MIEFSLYWDDLTEDCQKRLQQTLSLEEDDNNNWDLIPITTLMWEEE